MNNVRRARNDLDRGHAKRTVALLKGASDAQLAAYAQRLVDHHFHGAPHPMQFGMRPAGALADVVELDLTRQCECGNHLPVQRRGRPRQYCLTCRPRKVAA